MRESITDDTLSSDEYKPFNDAAFKREEWGNQIEFFLTCVGYSVGLGNLWRFPYLCMQQGGGAFLIPYLLFLFICGLPLFFMETAIGQSTGLSTVRIFRMIPLFSGLGWCMVAASGILSIYYNVIIAWVLYFLGMSFFWHLPWTDCNNSWNTPNCFIYDGNVTLVRNSTTNGTKVLRSAAEEFWRYNVLEITDSIDDLGGIQWKLFICITVAWTIVFLCMFRGIRTSGKVVYVTALAPYVLLTVILIRGVTLPGAWLGLKYYVIPEWSKLLQTKVWIAAATQIFYSLGPAWGGLITFGSFNRLDHNLLRDATLIPIICCCTSIYGGFAIFSVIGHMMYITGQEDTTNLMNYGPGLAFIAYPQALVKLPGAAIWSVLFFLTLLTLGLDSQFGTLEAVITGLSDRFPDTVGRHKILLTAAVCFIEYLLGIIFVTRAGFYYFELMDYYSTAFSVLLLGLMEALVISYLYGARRLIRDIESMIGKLRKWNAIWWLVNWYALVPLMTLFIIVSTIVDEVSMSSEQSKKYPVWAIIFGWCVAACSFIELPILAVVALVRHGCNWRKLLRPSDDWELTIRHRRIMFNSRASLPR